MGESSSPSTFIWMARLLPKRPWPEHLSRGVLGVFLIFMAVGFQFEMLHAEPLSWPRGLCNALLTGLISVVWFLLGTLRMWWAMFVPIVLQLFVLPQIFRAVERTGVFTIGQEMSRRSTMVLLVILTIAVLALGFGMLMRTMVFTARRTQAARAELEIARRVHESIVPPIEITLPGLQILARSRASSTMGGDLIDVVRREGEVDLFVADVSGHGVKAGIVMAMLKATVRMRLSAGGQLGEILQDVNRTLADLIDPSMFATLACVRVRTSKDGGADVEYALAGHLPILHIRESEGSVRDLPNESLPLGIEPAELYAAGRTRAMRGDVLVLMTDGLVEVQGSGGRELGFAALRELVRSGAGGGTLDDMHGRVMAFVDAHGAQLDDQTLAIVRIG